MTNREIISKVRKSIQESTADSTYTNKFIYSKLHEHLKWLIRREASSGTIFKSTSIFQTARCLDVIKVPSVDKCCAVSTCCVIYRTRHKLDPIWNDTYGPLIKRVTSIDGSTSFLPISPTDWERKEKNPYLKNNKELYSFFSDGYLWFPKEAPKKVSVEGLFIEDIKGKYNCDKTVSSKCLKFLDKDFILPEYLEAELVSRVVEQLANITKRIPEDSDINKNTNRDT